MLGEYKRKDDPPDANFADLRVPRKWRILMYWISGIATFIASFYAVMQKEELEKTIVAPATILERVEGIVFKLAGVSEQLNQVNIRLDEQRDQLVEIKRMVLESQRKNRDNAEHADDRATQILDAVESLQKKKR